MFCWWYVARGHGKMNCAACIEALTCRRAFNSAALLNRAGLSGDLGGWPAVHATKTQLLYVSYLLHCGWDAPVPAISNQQQIRSLLLLPRPSFKGSMQAMVLMHCLLV